MNRKELLALLPKLPEPTMYWKLWEEKAYPGGPTIYDEVTLAIAEKRTMKEPVVEPKDPVRRGVFWALLRGQLQETDTKPEIVRYEDREVEHILVATIFFDDLKVKGATDSYIYDHLTDTISLEYLTADMVRDAVRMLLKRLEAEAMQGDYR